VDRSEAGGGGGKNDYGGGGDGIAEDVTDGAASAAFPFTCPSISSCSSLNSARKADRMFSVSSSLIPPSAHAGYPGGAHV